MADGEMWIPINRFPPPPPNGDRSGEVWIRSGNIEERAQYRHKSSASGPPGWYAMEGEPIQIVPTHYRPV